MGETWQTLDQLSRLSQFVKCVNFNAWKSPCFCMARMSVTGKLLCRLFTSFKFKLVFFITENRQVTYSSPSNSASADIFQWNRPSFLWWLTSPISWVKISSVKFSDYFLECMELIDYKYRTFYLDLSLWRLLGDRSLCNARGDIGDTE